MAESTLNVSLNTYLAQVGHFLGWGFGSTAQTGPDYNDIAWSTFEFSEVMFCVKSGISQFYLANEWTFLKPTEPLQIPAGVSTVQLPDDFGGFEGPITLSSVSAPSSVYRQIPVILPAQIDEKYALNPTVTGPMAWASQQPIKGTTQVSSTRDQLYFYPISDQVYVVKVRYYILADMLSGNNPYVYGGAQHAQTILQSCISVAEFRKDNQLGTQTAKYNELLQMSKQADNRLKPQHFGRNKDTSDDYRFRRNPHAVIPLSTYNGQSFD